MAGVLIVENIFLYLIFSSKLFTDVFIYTFKAYSKTTGGQYNT